MVRSIPVSVWFNFPAPNYENPQTRGPTLIIVNAICISLCTIALVLRLYTRIFVKRWFGSDDVLIICAYIATVGLSVIVIVANYKYYWNRHVWDIPIAGFPPLFKIAFAGKEVFIIATAFTRQSLLAFYHRLATDSDIKPFLWAVRIAIVLNVINFFIFEGLQIWTCVPVRAYWELPPPKGSHCMNEGVGVLWISIVNVLADVVVTVLPIPLIMRLHMPRRERAGVIFLLSLGFIVVAAGCFRTYYSWKGLIASWDRTWYAHPIYIAASVEVNLGVICACAPPLRPLMSRYIKPAIATLGSQITSFFGSATHSGRPSRQASYNVSSSEDPDKGLTSVRDDAHSQWGMLKHKASKISMRLANNCKQPTTEVQSEQPDMRERDPDEVTFITYPAGLDPRHARRASKAALRNCSTSTSSSTALPYQSRKYSAQISPTDASFPPSQPVSPTATTFAAAAPSSLLTVPTSAPSSKTNSPTSPTFPSNQLAVPAAAVRGSLPSPGAGAAAAAAVAELRKPSLEIRCCQSIELSHDYRPATAPGATGESYYSMHRPSTAGGPDDDNAAAAADAAEYQDGLLELDPRERIGSEAFGFTTECVGGEQVDRASGSGSGSGSEGDGEGLRAVPGLMRKISFRRS